MSVPAEVAPAAEQTNPTTETEQPAVEQAPVTEPEQETAPEQTTTEPEQEPVEKPTETPKFDTKAAKGVEGFLTDAGLVPADVAREITSSDGEISPEIMKALVEKHGESVAALVAEKLEGLHKSNKAVAEARDKAVYDQLQEAFQGVTEDDGKSIWGELSGWAKEHVPNEDRRELNELLQKGGLQAKLAVAELVSRFKGSDQFTQPAELMDADTTTNFGESLIDRVTYNKELNKLLEAGHDYNTSPEIRALDRRRNKSIARGV